MKREEFNKLNIDDKIKYLNDKLSEGQTVTKIREELGIGEKSLQRQIKEGGYKYNNKTKTYIKITDSTTTSTTKENEVIVVDKNTNVVVKNEDSKYLSENIEILKEMIEKYKITRATTTSTTSIVIDLISDKHLNPKPHSLRLNEFVWQDWQKFCENNKYYSKQDLLSMALKEYMEKYND